MDHSVGARTCRHGRRAVVCRKLLLRIIVGRPRMLRLLGDRSGTFPASGRLFFRRGERVDSTTTAIVAGAVIIVVHPGVVNAVDGSERMNQTRIASPFGDDQGTRRANLFRIGQYLRGLRPAQ